MNDTIHLCEHKTSLVTSRPQVRISPTVFPPFSTYGLYVRVDLLITQGIIIYNNNYKVCYYVCTNSDLEMD